MKVYRSGANTMDSLSGVLARRNLPGECRVPGKPVDFYLIVVFAAADFLRDVRQLIKKLSLSAGAAIAPDMRCLFYDAMDLTTCVILRVV